MNDALTSDLWEQIVDAATKLERYKQKFDVILLTNKEECAIRDLVQTVKPTDPYYFENRIAGMRFETFLTKKKVLERAEELIKKGMRVMVLKDE